MSELIALSCLSDGVPGGAWETSVDRLTAGTVHSVGPRPGKQIDPLLTGRVLVIGDDADLAAVVLRLLRKDLLGTVEVAYAPAGPTAFTRLWGLPFGEAAVAGAETGAAVQVPLVRDDAGGVLIGLGVLAPVAGTVYVDEHRVLRGPAARIEVQPDRGRGLAATVTGPRRLGILPGKSVRTEGRAVQIGTLPVIPERDGVPYPRPMDRWTWYKHTEPLLLVGAREV